jgi:hypothetical protein
VNSPEDEESCDIEKKVQSTRRMKNNAEKKRINIGMRRQIEKNSEERGKQTRKREVRPEQTGKSDGKASWQINARKHNLWTREDPKRRR